MSQKNTNNAIHIHSSFEVTPRCEMSIRFSTSFHVPVSTRTQITTLVDKYPSFDATSFLNICDHVDNMVNTNYQVLVNSGLPPIEPIVNDEISDYIEQTNPGLAKLSSLLDDYEKCGYINVELNEESKTFIKSTLDTFNQKEKSSPYKKIFEIVTFIYMIVEILRYTFSPIPDTIKQNCYHWVYESLDFLENEIHNIPLDR